MKPYEVHILVQRCLARTKFRQIFFQTSQRIRKLASHAIFLGKKRGCMWVNT